jgi:hypothetical protein
MNNKDNKKISPARLSEHERAQMQREFNLFMESHPANEISARRVLSPYLVFLRSPILYAFSLFLILGGTVYAAEHSLPQELLYPLKTDVIEPFALQVATLSGTSRGHAHSILVERRLEEAETLIAEGAFEAGSLEILTEKIEKSSDNIQEFISNTVKSGNLDKALETGSRLEAVLEAHEEVLDSVIEEHASSTTSAETENFIDAIEEEGDEAEEATELVEQQFVERLDPEIELYIANLQERVRSTIEQLEETSILFSNDENELTSGAAELLASAKEYQQKSLEFLEKGEFEEVLFNLREALSESEKALIILESNENLEQFDNEMFEDGTSSAQ